MTLTGNALSPPDICIDDGGWSAAKLTGLIARAAGAVRALRAEAVGICLPNCWEYILLILACVHARIPVYLLSPKWPPEDIAGKLTRIRAAVVVTRRTDLKTKHISPDDLLAAPKSAPPSSLDYDMPATITFTSGSTSLPKAAVHNLGHHVASANGVIQRLGLGRDDRWLLTLPLYHVSGLSVVFRCAMARAAVALSEKPLYEALVDSQATHVSLVSVQLQQLLEQTQHRALPSSLKAMIVGGGPVPESILAAARAKDWPVCTTYGLTEMGSMVTLAAPDKHLDTVGQLLPGREMAIAPDGEILVRGNTLFAGYLESGQLTRPLDADGWFHTQDLGRLDASGRLIVLGRKDDMFISGGENISPQEIERVLVAMTGIAEAVVVPAMDELFGARPVAFVKGEYDDALVRSKLARLLPKFKIPAIRSWPADIPSQGIKTPRRYFEELARSKF